LKLSPAASAGMAHIPSSTIIDASLFIIPSGWIRFGLP
jgi:hypothetical protein